MPILGFSRCQGFIEIFLGWIPHFQTAFETNLNKSSFFCCHRLQHIYGFHCCCARCALEAEHGGQHSDGFVSQWGTQGYPWIPYKIYKSVLKLWQFSCMFWNFANYEAPEPQKSVWHRLHMHWLLRSWQTDWSRPVEDLASMWRNSPNPLVGTSDWHYHFQS